MTTKTEPLHPTAAGAAAMKRRKGKGTCQICGRKITTRADGMPARTHNQRVVHNPEAHPDHHEVSDTECYGSRLPPAEYVAAFNAARS